MLKPLMKAILPSILILCTFSLFSQGLPPGWDFAATPSTFIISVPLGSNPNINGFTLKPGDYIGVFYLDDNNELKCGGATEWYGDQNTGIIAFGDDSFTSTKDGFDYLETINFRFYSWSVQREYDAEVICNTSLPQNCDQYVSNGLAGIESAWAEGYYIDVVATPPDLCNGGATQLSVTPTGGQGNYSFQWSSNPSGFSSTLQNPVFTVSATTLFTVQVTDDNETLTSSVLVEVVLSPVATAGQDQTICETQSFVQLNGSQSNGFEYSWITSGDGTFNDSALLDAKYFPGTSDIATGNVDLDLVVQPLEPCTQPAVSSVLLQIIGLPQISVGENRTVCEDVDVAVFADLSNFDEILWESSGDGFFENPEIPETIYYPGTQDLIAGNFELTATAFAISPCAGFVEDGFSVEITMLPEVAAGQNQLICEDDIVSLSGSVDNAASYLWITAGDGTFASPGNLFTDYYPGLDDINQGVAQLSLTAESIPPCAADISDELTITIVKNPYVDIGEDATICENASMQFSANVTGFDEILWSTEGDGTFSDPFAPNTVYNPGQQDIQNGNVMISLIAEPQFPCTIGADDQMILNIQKLPEVNAGEDLTIQANESVQLSAIAENYSAISWNTYGDGTFNSIEILNPVYTHGIEDAGNGGVQLQISAFPESPCIVNAEDQITITIDTVTNVNYLSREIDFLIFPNPAKGKLNITSTHFSGNEIIQITLYANTGKVIRSFNKRISGGKLQVDFTGQGSGSYVLKLSTSKFSFSSKIVLTD
jgi:hypothetical protein